MRIPINLRQLESKPLRLKGEIPPDALDLVHLDELISTSGPVLYDLEAEEMDRAVLVQGRVELTLDCECVRCLAAFKYHLVLDRWAGLLPLEGEDAVPVVNDCVDLTPFLREDIVLAFPQHPLCKPECVGAILPGGEKPDADPKADPNLGSVKESKPAATPWAALDKLKLN